MYNLYISVRLPSDARCGDRCGAPAVVCACVRSLCRLRDARLLYIRKQPHHQGVWAFKLSYVPRPSIVFFILARARARARVTVSLKGLAARGHLNTLQLLVIW